MQCAAMTRALLIQEIMVTAMLNLLNLLVFRGLQAAAGRRCWQTRFVVKL
jgi:hypothetical protein